MPGKSSHAVHLLLYSSLTIALYLYRSSGLLLNLTDAGDPALDFRSARPSRPTSLRTSDRNSLLRYMGLPLHTFGADAFFQPYLPLQQIDQLTAKSWLVGTTNSIVTQQRDCEWDLLINASPIIHGS